MRSAGSPSLFCVRRECPSGLCCVMFLSLRDPCSAFSSPACYNLIFIFGASSLAAAVNILPVGVFQRRRYLIALPGLHLIQSAAKFHHKTSQHQFRLVFRFRSGTNADRSRTKIIIWHDVINNYLTPHSSNFNHPLSPQALIQELRALPCDIAAIVYCQRTGSPDVLQLLRQSFLVRSAVRHLLSRRKQHNLALVQQYSVLHLAVHLKLKIFFFVVSTPSSIEDLNSQEIQTQQSTPSVFIPPHPPRPATAVFINQFFPSHTSADTVHTSDTLIFFALLLLLQIFCLGLVVPPPGFPFLDPFGGGFRGAAWVVSEPCLFSIAWTQVSRRAWYNRQKWTKFSNKRK